MKSPFSLLVVAIVICILVLTGYGVWYSAISAKSADVADLQSSIDTKTETVNRIAATRATLAGIADDEATVQGYFVPETGVVAFINALEARGKEQGASISVLSVSTSGTSARPTLTLMLSIKGTFDEVMRTIGSIEYAPYDLSVSTLSIAQDATSVWHADLKLLIGSVPAARLATSTRAVSLTAFAPSLYVY
jgi:hypothetical protein